MILVFLVGGSRLFRAGLRIAIESSDIKVICEYSNDDQIKITSDVWGEGLVFLFKPSDSGEIGDQIASLRRLEPKAQVVVILSKLTIDGLVSAFVAGADGLVLEDISSAALRESLRLIKLGEKIFPSQLAALLGGERRSPLFRIDRSESITKRELEILNCLAVGMCNKSIATHLGLAVGTVKVHVKSLLKKLTLKNRTQAAIWAVNAGLVPAPSVLLQSTEPPEGRAVHLHAEPTASMLN